MRTPLSRLASTSRIARLVAILPLVGLVAASAARAEDAAKATSSAPTGQRVFSAGHSFHVFVPPLLAEMAKSAGIADHVLVGVQGIGGSQVIQQWRDRDRAKQAVENDKLDVLTLSPIYLPDEGIENFTRLVAEKSPQTRILLQEFWLPYDVYNLEYKKQRPPAPDRDAQNLEQLAAAHAEYFKSMDDHVRALNAKYGKTILYVVPVGQAVLALREKVVAGEAPGLKKQSELFTDPIGHVTNPIKALNAYCHYAVVYRRSPVGLPAPEALKAVGDEETVAKLNRLLQELAWQAALAHPLSGVKATP